MMKNNELYFNDANLLLAEGRNGDGSFDSKINGQRVFIGDYLDDFCWGALFSSLDAKELTLLGSSIGAGVRSAFSVKEFDTVNCIDLDEDALKQCHQLYKSLGFNGLTTIKEDAVQYIIGLDRQITGTILIDLFDDHGHIPLVGDILFYQLLSEKLTDQAVCQLNVYTMPAFLGHKNDPLSSVIYAIKKSFDYIKIIPHRRNYSIIFSKTELTMKEKINSKLSKNDSEILKLKIKNVLEISQKEKLKNNKIHLTYKNINNEFRTHYIEFYKETMGNLGINVTEISEESKGKDISKLNYIVEQGLERNTKFLLFYLMTCFNFDFSPKEYFTLAQILEKLSKENKSLDKEIKNQIINIYLKYQGCELYSKGNTLISYLLNEVEYDYA